MSFLSEHFYSNFHKKMFICYYQIVGLCGKSKMLYLECVLMLLAADSISNKFIYMYKSCQI